MSRSLRLQYPGAVYHLTSRGNAQQPIFWGAGDREIFLNILAVAIARCDWLCHAYCLMDNHYHLLVETPQPNLSIGMRQLNGLYTQSFNRKHGRVGHLFQGRYKAIVVQKQEHLLELCRYVVLNPLRVGKPRGIHNWKWTSYPPTAGLQRVPAFLMVDWILAQFGTTRSAAQAAYRAFVTKGSERRPWQQLRGQIFLGDDDFIKWHEKTTDDISEIPRAQWQTVKPALEQIFRDQGEQAIAVAYREFGYRLKEIAEFLGVHYATVSRRLKELETENV